MDNADYQKLREAGWRRRLSAAEEEGLRRALASKPELQAHWDEEVALNRLLSRTPPPRVSSNFTARVMQAARTATPQRVGWSERYAPFQWLSRNWMPRVALGLAMVCCGVVSFREYQAAHRARMVHELASVGGVPMDWLKNFDTINRLNKVSVADDDLLAALR
ncbi:MAG TPA: hypothetical protein VHZ30_05790 [Verrucomicrobiae bacterium]|jgi:anti-sigma factor RsiW|nr:hypothetical protein [Verrucomicrobiae bacterium]